MPVHRNQLTPISFPTSKTKLKPPPNTPFQNFLRIKRTIKYLPNETNTWFIRLFKTTLQHSEIEFSPQASIYVNGFTEIY